MMRFTLPQMPWHGNTLMELDLPDEWDIEYCPMAGELDQPLSLQQMEFTISHPIGSASLRAVAKRKKKAVIIFDDMTRPTRTYELAPIVLKELLAAGITEDNITFVCALGTHGALTMSDFRKKLGSEIIERYRVYNHNIYENCVEVGTTKRGTRMMVNREVMEADLKIAIGCVTAHVQAGYSGGGKILLPGVAHIDSISHYHLDVEAMGKETTGTAKHHGNILREEINEAAAMVGLDFMINVVVNGRGATTGVFAGELFETHEKAVSAAKIIYATEPRPFEKDVAVVNAFSKPNEMGIAILLGMQSLKDFSGTVVVIANSPEGQVPHYLLGRFGSTYGGRQYPVATIPDSVRLIIMTAYPDKTIADWFSNPNKAIIKRNWQEVMEIVGPVHGPGTKAVILPNATMQYFAD